ncbi:MULTISPECIES: recombination-associated protein RdgC [Gammaproteobacteria]|uniref:Recombination-associated protein RdgC n=1 Tax=Klebsiella quasipneumoniae subsp. quasipneumoniae TaxID=1667327 RepID=A0AAW8XU88_9ENTR|nr:MULTISPECIES: recombination-associated protein RdgC [Gammaproteobacteria]MDV0844694.1 recombination-associated protein RdgC [Klebsiella quasipneumoniae subsp. quasipneumoniae]HCG2921407.1 recombination-associated protein RdgC [Klebsiella pneumoniae]HCG2948084.1 recombination-associated protein RdgC [Klebsiella pneumoniae]
MWFKNLSVYRFTRPFELTAEQLEIQLKTCAFTPCGSQDISKFGWVKPLGKFGSMLTHSAQGHILICARKEEKLLPTAIVNELLAEKIEEVEHEQGRALKKKEKAALKEELLHTLLPRAFSRTNQTLAWLNPAENLLVVDSSSAKRADDLLALLRKSIGSLPVVPVALKNPPEITMTEWLNEGNLPASFTLEDEAELRSAMEEGGIIRCKKQDLMTDEIKHHLSNDKLVTKLALNWGDTLSFVLGDDLSIKRLKFSEELREQNDDVSNEDPAARIDADFALVTAELSQFIPALFAALGGEEQAQ